MVPHELTGLSLASIAVTPKMDVGHPFNVAG